MNKGIKITSCTFHAAVTVRESDKRHFQQHSAVSEDGGVSCLPLMCLLLSRTHRKCNGKMSFTSLMQSMVKRSIGVKMTDMSGLFSLLTDLSVVFPIHFFNRLLHKMSENAYLVRPKPQYSQFKII